MFRTTAGRWDGISATAMNGGEICRMVTRRLKLAGLPMLNLRYLWEVVWRIGFLMRHTFVFLRFREALLLRACRFCGKELINVPDSELF